MAFELFAGVGTVFPVERENEFHAICATTATIAAYFAFNETIAFWLEQQGVPASQARDYIARLFLGVTTGAVEAPDAFGSEVDYAQLHKVYRAPLENETRYSPAKCIGCDMKAVSGNPDFKHVSTSFVERQNWTVRTTMRRYTRLSNGFSRKMENHAAATALNYFAYNFIKIHRTLRTSPAMAAGVTDRLWSVEDLVALWESYEQQRAERAA